MRYALIAVAGGAVAVAALSCSSRPDSPSPIKSTYSELLRQFEARGIPVNRVSRNTVQDNSQGDDLSHYEISVDKHIPGPDKTLEDDDLALMEEFAASVDAVDLDVDSSLNMTAEQFARLLQLPHLQAVTLDFQRSDAMWSATPARSTAKRLRIQNMEIPVDVIERIREWPQLRELDLSDGYLALCPALEIRGGFPALEVLSLSLLLSRDRGREDDSAEAFEAGVVNLPKLRRVAVQVIDDHRGFPTKHSVRLRLEGLSACESFVYRNFSSTEEGFAGDDDPDPGHHVYAKGCDRLRFVHVNSGDSSNGFCPLDGLASLPALESVWIDCPSTAAAEREATILSHLSSVRRVRLGARHFDPAIFEALAALPKVDTIEVHGGVELPTSGEALTRSASLRRLVYGCTRQWYEEGLAAHAWLARIPNLEELDLAQFSPNVETVGFPNGVVRPSKIPFLKEMKGLKKLEVHKLDDESLRTSLPHTKIIEKPSPRLSAFGGGYGFASDKATLIEAARSQPEVDWPISAGSP